MNHELQIFKVDLEKAEEPAGIFGVRTVKLDDAEYTPRLISLVHPFCIMATSLGLRTSEPPGKPLWEPRPPILVVGAVSTISRVGHWE